MAKKKEDNRDIFDKALEPDYLESKYTVPAGTIIGGIIGATMARRVKRVPKGGTRSDMGAVGGVIGAPMGAGAGSIASLINDIEKKRAAGKEIKMISRARRK